MKRLTWWCRWFLHQFGAASAAGLLLLGIVVFHYAVVIPERQRLQRVQKETKRLTQRLAQQAARPAVLTPDQQLGRFYDVLPEASAQVMAQALSKLYALASAESLALEQGDYRLLTEPAEPLARFEILLPVKGGYPQLRQFMANALRELPTLALESVSLSRSAVSDVNVDAQLRFALYLKKV